MLFQSKVPDIAGFFKKEDLMLIARLSKEIQKMGADYHLESNMR